MMFAANTASAQEPTTIGSPRMAKSKDGGLSVSELKRTKELEAENAKLKRMYADLAIENDAIKDLLEKSLGAKRTEKLCWPPQQALSTLD